MSYIIDIATAVPEFKVSKQELVDFYANALKPTSSNSNTINQKINFLNAKTQIEERYSCIPDFNGQTFELFETSNYNPSVEKRTELYKQKVLPLANKAIDKLFFKTKIKPEEITHIITVSCTGLFAPGFEFLLAEHYNLQHTEKLALNFLGCYAAIKALKQANYIAKANPNACILIVCAELCSLHFTPSAIDEDIVSNLLFADGAAATLVSGSENKYSQDKLVLNIDTIGSVYIPDTLNLMTWNISSSAFKMYLNKEIPNTIKSNIQPVINNFLRGDTPDYWAIHPGGVRIVDAIKESLNLSERNIESSKNILQQYGNMSSPTILFVLKNILDSMTDSQDFNNKKILCCAFGPGLSIEMINFSTVYKMYSTTLNPLS